MIIKKTFNKHLKQNKYKNKGSFATVLYYLTWADRLADVRSSNWEPCFRCIMVTAHFRDYVACRWCPGAAQRLITYSFKGRRLRAASKRHWIKLKYIAELNEGIKEYHPLEFMFYFAVSVCVCFVFWFNQVLSVERFSRHRFYFEFYVSNKRIISIH